MSKLYQIQFADSKHPPLELPENTELSEALDIQNSPVLFGCRTGICGTCLVKVLESSTPLPPRTSEEEDLLEIIAPEEPKARLACQLKLCSHLTLHPLTAQ